LQLRTCIIRLMELKLEWWMIILISLIQRRV
jgi:hypothetical protein